MRQRIVAWTLTVAVTFPILYFVVDFASIRGLDIMFLLWCTAIVGLVVDDFVAARSLTKR